MFDAAFAQLPRHRGLMATSIRRTLSQRKVIREHQLTIEEVTAVVIEVLGLPAW